MKLKVYQAFVSIALALNLSFAGAQEKVSDEDVMLICQTARSGMFKASRAFGQEVYGSVEAFYSRFGGIDCGSYYVNPIILGVEQNILEAELHTELEMIRDHMDPELIEHLINMPSSEGRYSRTIMDIAQKQHDVAVKSDNKPAIRLIGHIVNKLEKLGAKKLKDLTPEQRSRYPYLKEN